MRKAGRAGRTVVLRLRFGDFKRATRSRTLAYAHRLAHPSVLLAARGLLAEATPTIRRRGLTLIGIAVTNLEPAAPASSSSCRSAIGEAGGLETALDELRDRFGNAAITRGRCCAPPRARAVGSCPATATQ